MCVRYVARSGLAGARRWKTCMMILEILISREIDDHICAIIIFVHKSPPIQQWYFHSIIALHSSFCMKAIVDLSRALLFCLTLAVRLQSQHKTQHNLSIIHDELSWEANYELSHLHSMRSSTIFHFNVSILHRFALLFIPSHSPEIAAILSCFLYCEKRTIKTM